MLNEQTLDKLYTMKLHGMAAAFKEQLEQPDISSLSFEERLGLLVDREWTHREDRRLALRLKAAKLKQSACLEDIDYHHPRGLDRAIIASLATCSWIRFHHNLLITGATGTGKTYLACAMANQACRQGYSALYFRASRLLHDLLISRADGTYLRLLNKIAKANLLVVDDWGLALLVEGEPRDFLDILEDRNGSASTLITSQLPVSEWYELIKEPTIADAILDRLVHNAHRIELKGPSMRKTKGGLMMEVGHSEQ